MKKRLAAVAGLTLLLGVLAAPAAQASSHFSVGIGVGAPYVAAPYAPYARPVWRPGHYVWTRFGYRWVPGAWIRPAAVYAPYARPRVVYEPRVRVRADWGRDGLYRR
jgi:hypothetical protein